MIYSPKLVTSTERCMPKIVDHESKRQQIAISAIEVFLELGYKNVGMRQLCQQLGMSKSAVYHYYPSKDQLFIAATEAMVSMDIELLAGRPKASEANIDERVENFLLVFEQIAPRFFQEMKLVSDYIDVIGQQNVATDPCMLLANNKYLSMLETYVSPQDKESIYSLLLGLLNQQVLMGRSLDRAFVVKQVERVIKEG